MTYTQPAGTRQPSYDFDNYMQQQYPPSAPPMEDPIQEKLKDDCSICLVPLNLQTDGDRNPNIVAQTKCNHLFHKFCMNQLLEKGTNTNCPLCRRNIKPVDLTYLTGSGQPIGRPQATQAPRVPQFPPVQQPYYAQPAQQQPRVQPVQRQQEPDLQNADRDALVEGMGELVQDAVTGIGSALYWGGWGLFKALDFGARAIASAFEETPQSIETRVTDLVQQWNKLSYENDVQTRKTKEEASVLLAMIKSLPFEKASRVRTAADRIDEGFKAYEQALRENHGRLQQLIAAEKGKLASL